MATRIRVRRDTTANWEAANPVLLEGEMGFDSDQQRLRVGDGTSEWTDLPGLVGDVPDDVMNDIDQSVQDAQSSAESALIAASDAQEAADQAAEAVSKAMVVFDGDGTGTVDVTSELQAAINTVAPGGTLVFQQGGVYAVEGPVSLPHGMTIDLNGSTVSKMPGASSLLMYNEHPENTLGYGAGGSGFTVKNGTIKGDCSTRLSAIIQYHHADDILYENVTWDESINGSHALDLMGCRNVTVDRCRFIGSNPHPDKLYGEAIQVDVSAYVSSSAKTYDPAGIWDGLPTINVTVRNSVFKSKGSYQTPVPLGSHLNALEGDEGWKSGVTFENNEVIGWCEPTPTGRAYGWLHGEGYRDLVIRNNKFKYTGTGTNEQPIAVINFSQAAVVIPESDVGSPSPSSVNDTSPRGLHNVVIEGNVFTGFDNAPGSPTGGVIFLRWDTDGSYGRGISVRGNKIHGANGTGIWVQGNTETQDESFSEVSDNLVTTDWNTEAIAVQRTGAIVANNSITARNSVGKGAYLGECRNSLFTGNRVFASRGVRIKSTFSTSVTNNFLSTSYYGLRVGQGSEVNTDALVTGNIIDGGTGGAFDITSDAVRTRRFGNQILSGTLVDNSSSTITAPTDQGGV